MPSAQTTPLFTWQRDIPMRYDAEVAVIGGGIAGVCAACAAAAEGASVVLVERFGVVGGNATVGGVANWSGETAGQGAVFDEIIDRQQQWHSIAPYPGPYGPKSGNRVFDHEILAVILQELLLEHGVRLLLHTRLVDARREDGRIGPALLAGASGLEGLSAEVFVDASGGGELARAAQCTTLPGGDLGPLPPSMMFFVRERPAPVEPQLPPGWFDPVRREQDLPMTSTWPAGPGGKALKVKVTGYDSGDTDSLSRLEIRARRRMWEVLDYYQRGFREDDAAGRRSDPGNAHARHWHFDHCSPMIGLRETRRIAGDYVLTVNDLRAGCAFEDGIARGVFYLDGMRPDDDKRTYLLSKEQMVVPPYHIPLRSLIARDADNLLVAGRCFSADQLALSSARVMPTCAMMGQAAGVAAAWSARRGCRVRDLDASAVRRRLESRGANLALP